MSQSSDLDCVAQWSREQCREKMAEVIPKILLRITNGTSAEIIEPMKLLCKHFAPICSSPQIDNILQNINKKVAAASDSFYVALTDVIKLTNVAVEEIHVRLVSILQNCMDLILCVNDLVVCYLELRGIKADHLRYLPSLVVSILQQTYRHCKDSSSIYGSVLEVLTDQLSSLFKSAHMLQNNFISFLEKLDLNEPDDCCIRDLCKVLEGLHDISVVAASLDVKITIVMWKTISRLACQHKDHLLGTLKLDSMMLVLAQDMDSSLTYISQLPNSKEDKTFSKAVKVLGFQMKVLVTLLKDYEACLSDCIPAVVKLVLLIQSSVCDVQSGIHTDCQAELQKHLAVALEPLTSYLIPNHKFIQELTRKHSGESKNCFAVCKILQIVLKLLPNYSDSIQSAWISPDNGGSLSVMDSVFNCLTHCYVELCFISQPSEMSSEQSQRGVSCYQRLLTSLCVFVASLPAQHFHVLEKCLLKNVLSDNIHCSVLATDVWCFVARYGTADLCYTHCMLLSSLLNQMLVTPSIQCCSLIHLLNRLVKFLAPEHQELYLRQFPAASNMDLYGVVQLVVFPAATVEPVITQLLSSCTHTARSWLRTTKHNHNDVKSLLSVYRVLCNLLSVCDIEGHSLLDASMTEMVGLTIACLEGIPHTLGTYTHDMNIAVSRMIQYLALVTNNMDNHILYKVVLEVSRWMKSEASRNSASVVRLAVLDLLAALGSYKLPPDAKQMPILRELPRIFGPLLADEDVLVQQAALQTFATFAEETAHETIVADSLQADEMIQTKVVTYLNDLSNGTAGNLDVDWLLKQQKILLQNNYHKNMAAPVVTAKSTNQPPTKRCRVDSPSQMMEGCEDALVLLGRGISELEQYCSVLGTLPVMYQPQILDLARRLQDLTQRSNPS